MKETIVFFDIDGTLLDEHNRLPYTTKEAILQLQRSGIRTAIATGRTPSQFEWIREELNIDTYVSANGQYVVYEGRELYANRMAPDRLRDMCDFAAERGHSLAFSSHAMLCATHAAHPLIGTSFGALSLEYPPVDPLFYTHSPVYQAYLFCPEQEEALYAERFPEFRYYRWHPVAADIMPAGGSKAVGIQKLLEAVGGTPAQCYAFGDGLNDKEMLAWVGTGIAMGNASDDVKAVADRVTASSSEGGIWHGLRQVGLL